MQKKKFYQKKWFMWLWLIILPPVGIVLMWLTQKEMKKKTKIIFTIVFLLWFLLLRSAMNSGSSTTENDNSEATQESSAVTDTVLSENETNEVKDTDITSEDFVSDVKEAIKGDVGKDEEIVDVTFVNGNLCVYVDFSKMDPSPLTKEDVALARTSSITDDILTLTQYESLWDTITVDFEEVGHITNGKDNLQVGATGKYFDAVNFAIEQ